jgi:tetratricopeptide (TPR) repeat protein
MGKALRDQKNGRLVQAAEGYRRVLAADPSNFDATHMLGLVEYERGRYEIALALVRRAIELQPNRGTPRHNLRVLESMPLVEAEVCLEVLPRLVYRVDLTVDVASLASAASVNVVIGETLGEQEHRSLSQIVAACGTAPITIWDELTGDARADGARALSAVEHPRGGALVLLGAARSPAAWLSQARAEHALLVATRAAPCEIIDRIDELSAAGYGRPGLLCATRALADRLRLPQALTLPQPARVARIDA